MITCIILLCLLNENSTIYIEEETFITILGILGILSIIQLIKLCLFIIRRILMKFGGLKVIEPKKTKNQKFTQEEINNYWDRMR